MMYAFFVTRGGEVEYSGSVEWGWNRASAGLHLRR